MTKARIIQNGRIVSYRDMINSKGAEERLPFFVTDLKPLFESRSDAESEGERMLNPPFVRAIAASVSVNARLQERE